MSHQTAIEEYDLALKAGQREARELTAAGKNPNPAVLDEILPGGKQDTAQEMSEQQCRPVPAGLQARLDFRH